MSKQTEVIIDYVAVGNLLHSAEIDEAILSEAQKMAHQCGGNVGNIYNAGSRDIVSVWCDDEDALLMARGG